MSTEQSQLVKKPRSSNELMKKLGSFMNWSNLSWVKKPTSSDELFPKRSSIMMVMNKENSDTPGLKLLGKTRESLVLKTN